MRIFCVSIPTTDAKEPAFAEASAGKPATSTKTQTKPWLHRDPKAPDRPIFIPKGEPPESVDPGGCCPILLRDLGDNPRADGPAAFADREAQALVHGDRGDQLDAQIGRASCRKECRAQCATYQ